MGAVNIFLGGTGKFIAEDIQDSRQFFDLPVGDPVAFDLNATIRPGVQLRDFVSADQQTIAGVQKLAGEWAQRDPGRMLGPAPDSGAPGPQITPEQTPLATIGTGIAANPAPTAGLFALRAHGLAVFSMLFDEGQARAGAGPGNELRRYIDARVREETRDGKPPRINLVTSTAGGTGAGMVIPLALWLREQHPHSPLNLVAVTASAFAGVLTGTPQLEEIATKGRSGTYALFRELSFFRRVDSRTKFAERRLPVTGKGLAYRPGGELFDRIYWFGGRTGGSRDDAFREAEPLLRVLSTDQTADDLRAETGASPLQWVGAVTAIEYPKLRLQRRMVFRALEDAYRSLRESGPRFAGAQAAGDAVSLLDYVDADTDRPLGAWFHAQRYGAMALPDHQVTEAASADLAARVQRAAETRGYGGVKRGTDIRGDNYDSGDAGWRQYVRQVVDGLREVAGDNEQRLGRAIGDLRKDEEQSFAAWLRATVFGGWLSASGGSEPLPTADVLQRLDRLEQDAEAFAARFGNDGLFPGDTVDDADRLRNRREEKFDTPDPRSAEPTRTERWLALGVAAAFFVIGGWAAWEIAEAIPQFAGGFSRMIPWIVVIAGSVGARWLTLWLLLRGRAEAAKPAVARRDAEDALFRACEHRDRVLALRWLHQELRGERAGEPFFGAFREEIRSAQAAVRRLDETYKGLQDRAAAEVRGGGVQPAHVREEVGVCLDDDPGMAERIRPQLRRRIRVEQAVAGLRVLLVHASDGDRSRYDQAGEDEADLRQALEAVNQAGMADAAKALERWEQAAWALVQWQLGEHLPDDFHQALLHCENQDASAALRALASKLANLELPKAPSVGLRSYAGVPEHRRVYAGSTEILARLNEARTELGSAQREMLGAYEHQPRVVPALGEQIVFLDLWADQGGAPWAPAVIGNAAEAESAMETYYGAQLGAPREATAEGTCFTVIPELLAATKLELGQGTVDPLAPAVAARLLGCDLDMQGPTYAELYYLLRHRGWLRDRDEGSGGPGSSTVTVLDDGAGEMPLVSRLVGDISDDAAAFGAGRVAVIGFDAFVEFMRYDGRRLVAGEEAWFSPYPQAEPQVRAWADAPARAAALQRAAVGEWYRGDVDGDAAAMLGVLRGDLAKMEDGEAAVRSSWKRAMERLLAGEERKAIRRNHARRPAAAEE